MKPLSSSLLIKRPSISSSIFTLAAFVIVARLLGKEEFGKLGIIQVTVAMFQIFAGFGLGPLRDGPLQRRAPSGVKRVDLLAVAILAGAAGTTGGRVESAQLRQALLFGRQGGLEGVRQLGIVHGDDSEPGL